MENMKINLTDHAKEMLLHRLHIHENKMQKIALKAWRSVHIPSHSEIPSVDYYQNNNTFEYRKLMGQIFVFSRVKCDVVNLVTLFPPVIKLAHKSSKIGSLKRKYVI